MAESFKIGDAPWEKGESFPVGQAPWEKYQHQDSPVTGDAGSIDKPYETNLFDDADRTKSSFGNPQGILNMLKAKKYVDVAKNKNGDMVFKDAQGDWHKDASNFTDHPVNWMESHAGKGLPLVGGIGGGILGAFEGGVGAVPGAAAGGIGGEDVRQLIGNQLGSFDDSNDTGLEEMGKEGVAMAAGEGAGKYVLSPIAKAASPYLSPVGDAAGNLIKQGVARGAELTSGVPKEAVMRLMERPSEVLNPRNALDVAKDARDELAARNQSEGALSGVARDEFTAQHGERPIDTTPVLNSQDEFLAKKNPIPNEPGALSPKEVASMGELRKRLTTEGGPLKSAQSLQNFADFLDTQIKSFEQNMTPGSAATPYQAQLQRMYGQVKGLLHKVDPEGLGAADARYSQFADDANMLSGLENPKTAEGFVNNYYGPNKGMIREASENVIPGSVDDIADLGASKAFSAQGPAGSHSGLRNIATGALGGAGLYEHSPLMMGAAALLQPQVQKQIIGRTSQMIQSPLLRAVAANPRLLQTMNPEIRDLVTNVMSQAPDYLKSADSDNGRQDQAHYDPGEGRAQPLDDGKQKFLEGN